MVIDLDNPLDGNQCLHRAEVFGSRPIEERLLWVRPCFPSCALHSLHVLLGLFLRWEVRGRTATILMVAASSISSKQLAVFLSPSFFSKRFVRVRMLQPCNSIDTAPSWKYSCFYSPERSNFRIIVDLLIAVHAMPCQCVCQHHLQLKRYCYQGIWTGLLISGFCLLMKRCHHLDLNACTLFYLCSVRDKRLWLFASGSTSEIRLELVY